MFDKIQLTGETHSEETIKERVRDLDGKVVSESTVKETQGDFDQVSFQCENEKVTLRGKITEILRSTGVSAAVAVRVEVPGRASFDVTSNDSPHLTNGDGEDSEAPEGATYTPVYGGKAQ